jgi:hypothetical protein
MVNKFKTVSIGVRRLSVLFWSQTETRLLGESHVAQYDTTPSARSRAGSTIRETLLYLSPLPHVTL